MVSRSHADTERCVFLQRSRRAGDLAHMRPWLRGMKRTWRASAGWCLAILVSASVSNRARATEAPQTLRIEEIGGGSMLVARDGGARLTIPRAAPEAALPLLAHLRPRGGVPPLREVVVIPDLSLAAGAVPRALAGEDGLLGTHDDIAVFASLLPTATLSPEDPIHVGLDRALRTSPRLVPGVRTCLDGSEGRPNGACAAVRSWQMPPSASPPALSLCVEAAGQVVWVPGIVGVEFYAQSLLSCSGATVLWIHEAALARALAGDRAWIDLLAQDLVVVVSPEGSTRCGPRRSSLQALAPRTVVLLAPTGRHNTGQCAGQVDMPDCSPITRVEPIRWTSQ